MIKMPLQRRLWAVFAVALLLFVSLAASTWWSARQNVLTFRRAEHTRQVLEEIEALKTALLNTETASRGFAIAGAERFLEPYEEGRVEALGAYANLSRLVADDAAHAATLGQLERLIREKLRFIGDVIRVRREEGAAEATSLIALGHGKTLMDQIRTLLGTMEAREEEALRAQADSAGARRFSSAARRPAPWSAFRCKGRCAVSFECKRRRRRRAAAGRSWRRRVARTG